MATWNAKEEYLRFMKETIHPLMREQGFSKRGNTFFRKRGELEDSVHFKSHWKGGGPTAERVCLRIEVGIIVRDWIPIMYRHLGGSKVGQYSPSNGALQLFMDDVGSRTPYWGLGSEAIPDVDQPMHTLPSELQARLFPWIDRIVGLQDVIGIYEKIMRLSDESEYLRLPWDQITCHLGLAALYVVDGRQKKAIETLVQLGKSDMTSAKRRAITRNFDSLMLQAIEMSPI